jgi:hypothetical protein
MEPNPVIEVVLKKISENYNRRAISSQYPFLLPFILGGRRFVNNAKQRINPKIARGKSEIFFASVIARHSSPLFRKLGDSDLRLQKGKIENLRIALKSLQGQIILP